MDGGPRRAESTLFRVTRSRRVGPFAEDALVKCGELIFSANQLSTMVSRTVYYGEDGTTISVFKGSELKNVGWLEQLCDMINIAFANGQLELNLENKRFREPSEIPEALGDEGICAVAFKDGYGDVPVATAAVKPWKGVHVGFEDNVTLELNESLEKSGAFAVDWELSSVAVTSKFAKQGLASRCTKIVEQELQQLVGNNKVVQVHLWVVATYIVEEYWKGNGYQEVASTIAPKGTWFAGQPFRIVILKRPLRQ